MNAFFEDFRLSFHLMLRRPRFALLTVLVLGVGIGASIAVFSLIDGVLLKPLPYPQSERLLMVGRVMGSGKIGPASQHKFSTWREQAKGFTSLSAYEQQASGFSVYAGDHAEYVSGARISAGLLRTLGVVIERGREFDRSDENGGVRRALLSHSLWGQMFGAAEDILGRRIELDGVGYEIIGVLPRGFIGPVKAQVWLPLTVNADPNDVAHSLTVVGRMAPDATLAMISQQLEALADNYREAFPQAVAQRESVAAMSMLSFVVGDLSSKLALLTGAVVALLLIAVANAASLGLARLNARSHEFAVRDALGASRWRIARMVFAESLALSCIAAVVGLALAYGVITTLDLWVPPSTLPRLESVVALDGSAIVVAVTLVVLLTLVLSGLSVMSLRRLGTELRVRAGGTHATARSRVVLVSAQLSLSTVLILVSSLLVGSLVQLSQTELGVDPSPLVAADLPVSESHLTDMSGLAVFLQRVRATLKRERDVDDVAIASSLPLESTINLPVEASPGSELVSVDVRMVTADYFATLGLHLLRGRAFEEGDHVGSEAVAIINDAYARAYLANDSTVIGNSLWVGRTIGPPWEDPVARRIVGVVTDVRDNGPEQEAPPTVYVPIVQFNNAAFWEASRYFAPVLIVRTRGNPNAMLPRLAAMVQAVDPRQAVARPRALADVYSDYLALPRFLSLLLGGFAALSLLLAVVGLYALISFIAQAQHRDTGVRLALGCSPGMILRSVLGQAVRVCVPGIAVGLVLYWPTMRWLVSLLPDIPAPSMALIVTTALALLAASLLASFFPALRASKTAPIAVLRQD